MTIKGQADIIKDLMLKTSNSIRVAMPASIESYDFKTQKADVKIDIQELYKDGTTIEYPVLSGVPVIFPRCGGASITMPVVRGDTCLLIFLDRDATSWLLGGKNVKPKSTRNHHLSDAIAIMGLCPFTNKSPSKNNNDLLINYDGSNITLKPKGIIDIASAKEINIKTDSIVINCKNAVVKSDENVKIACKTANINVTESLTAECQTLITKVSQSASIDCQTATIKASGSINTETPTFTQKGNMKVDGNIEITGTSLLAGKLTSQNGIENSGSNLVSNGKTFETHTHKYQDVTNVIAPSGGGPCTVTKTPTDSQQPN